jgi:hypothetical protein
LFGLELFEFEFGLVFEFELGLLLEFGVDWSLVVFVELLVPVFGLLAFSRFSEPLAEFVFIFAPELVPVP